MGLTPDISATDKSEIGNPKSEFTRNVCSDNEIKLLAEFFFSMGGCIFTI